ncbi:MAG: glutamate formimidoyltransferase [Candidatus Thermoplasmatota archaeon]
MKLIECVPNFSEGRNKEVIDTIINEARKYNVKILNIHSDESHNRTDVTILGEPEEVKKAVLDMAIKAVELIDMNKHRGEHPRMGAMDVVPFVPIMNTTMEECIKIANEFAEEFSKITKVPCFLYEEAAKKESRRNLADVRKGEFEGLREEIGKNPEKVPDYGPNSIHPTAGATAVGAREILIAFNVNLATNDVEIAKKIAKAVRYSSGGYRYVKAMGFEIKEKNIVQVSMNMTNYKQTPLFRVFETIKREAERYGVNVLSSEIVGMVPLDALIDVASFYLQLDDFKAEQVIEKRLLEMPMKSIEEFLEELASASPAPGGGSAAALGGAIACGLAEMVCNLTIGKKKYVEVEEEMKEKVEKLKYLRKDFLKLVEEDANAFNDVMKAIKEKRGLEEAYKKACEVPLRTAEKCTILMKDIKEIAEKGNKNSISDAGVAMLFAYASFNSAILNVKINLSCIQDSLYKEKMIEKVKEMEEEIEELKKETLQVVEKFINF